MPTKRSRYMKAADRELELNKAIINAFAQDPTLKYWVALGAGTGVTWIATLLNQRVSSGGTGASEVVKRGIMDYVGVVAGGAGGLAISELIVAFQQQAKDNPMGTIVGMTATWTGINAACLILSSMSGGKDGAGIMASILPVL